MKRLLAFLIIFILLFSVFFEAFEAHHDCEGEDCEICLALEACANLTQDIRTGASAAVPVSIFVLFIAASMACASRSMPHITPVDLRIQMNN